MTAWDWLLERIPVMEDDPSTLDLMDGVGARTVT